MFLVYSFAWFLPVLFQINATTLTSRDIEYQNPMLENFQTLTGFMWEYV